jgi:hypothetical protein
MSDDLTPAAGIGPHCPWCSAPLPSEDETACPSCGATLVGDTEAALPGVTALDAEAIMRNARNATPQRRSRLLSWISGEYDEGGETPAPPGSLAPPPPAVRREMLRLELEAEVANLQAETESIVSEAEVEAREEGWEPEPAGDGVAGQAAEPAELAVPADALIGDTPRDDASAPSAREPAEDPDRA